MLRAVTLLSGGLDSTTLAYYLKDEGYELICLSFDYGQRHKKELKVAGNIAFALGAEHYTVMLKAGDGSTPYGEPLGAILGDSVLVSGKEVPEGHYADENMKQTVVPNRNAIMLSIAYAVALAQKAKLVAFAAHAGDHTIYPDCRPEFVYALSGAFEVGARWKPGEYVPYVGGPFLQKTKAEIVALGTSLGVPFEKTWSCYKGGDIHCGVCGTCYERREAFELAGVVDPTEYADSETVFATPEGA